LWKTRERLSSDDSWEKTSLVENSSEDSSENLWERLSEYSLEMTREPLSSDDLWENTSLEVNLSEDSSESMWVKP
jgi:hypothetical protein